MLGVQKATPSLGVVSYNFTEEGPKIQEGHETRPSPPSKLVYI